MSTAVPPSHVLASWRGQSSRCKYCNQEIAWLVDSHDNWIPVEPASLGLGRPPRYNPDRHVDHRQTCPERQPQPFREATLAPYRFALECRVCGAALWLKAHHPVRAEAWKEMETAVREIWEKEHRHESKNPLRKESLDWGAVLLPKRKSSP